MRETKTLEVRGPETETGKRNRQRKRQRGERKEMVSVERRDPRWSAQALEAHGEGCGLCGGACGGRP